MGVCHYSYNHNLFSENSERGAYWFGFCVADAHVGGRTGHEVQLQVAARDRTVVEGFRVALETSRPVYNYWNRRFPKSAMYATSPVLAAALLQFNGSTLRTMSEDLRKHFVRGLFDGDGTVVCHDYVYDKIDTYHRKVSICGEEDVLRAVRDVSGVAGISAGNLARCGNIYRWTLQGAVNLQQFRRWLYDGANIFLRRKLEAFVLLDRISYPRRRRTQEVRF